MQNKNWYEYSPQIIAGCIGGAAFAIYRIIHGVPFMSAAGQGVFAGVLVFGALCAISNVFSAPEQKTSQTLDKFIQEKDAAQKPSFSSDTPVNTPAKEVLPPAPLPTVHRKQTKSSVQAPAEKVERKAKGHSIVRIPRHYTVVDTETTGLDPQKDRIIEIAAIRVRAGKEVARFETLVKPGRKLSKKIVELTGITDADLKDAPKQQEALQKFQEFLRDDIIVAHNAHFDVNFLYDSFQRCELAPLKNNFVDTLRLAKCIRPDLDNYKLSTLAEDYKIPQPTAHRALADCETTMAVLQKLSEEIDRRAIDLTQYQKFGFYSPFKVSEVTAEPGHEKPENPLYGKHCVFTGELDSMTRLEAAQAVMNIGGMCGDKILKKTSYLIAGRDEYHVGARAGDGGKVLQAKGLIQDGSTIQILTEQAFLEMLEQ